MEFKRKMFEDVKSIVFSERPLFSAKFVEQVGEQIPAVESSMVGFEEYIEAYTHCSAFKTVGLFYIHFRENNTFPINMIDQLAAPFEATDSIAGLYIIAENESALSKAYQFFKDDKRLLGIILESHIANDEDLKTCILESIVKFETLQKETALPPDELDFFEKIVSKFDDLETLKRFTILLTSQIEKDWLDDLLVDAGPAILSIPDQQRWILNNSKSLAKIDKQLDIARGMSVTDLVNSKSGSIIPRAVKLSHTLFELSKSEDLGLQIDQLTEKTTSFSPTLKKVLRNKKSAIVSIVNTTQWRKVA